MSDQNDLVKQEILEEIEIFVERLDIVHKALPQLHSRLIWEKWCRENPQAPRTKAAYMQIMKQYPQLGTWQDWHYFIHGMGCRLTHIDTGERLEWDVGDTRSFDKNWFANWLQWKLLYIDENSVCYSIPHLRKRLTLSDITTYEIKKVIFPILETLSQQQILSPEKNSHIYLLE